MKKVIPPLPPSRPTVLFDLDDTIVHASPIWQRVHEKLIKRFGGKLPDYVPKIPTGTSLHDRARTLCRLSGIDPEDVVDIYIPEYKKEDATLFASLSPQELIKPGALPLLKLLKQDNFHLGVVTNSRRDILDTRLQRSGLDKYFGVTVSSTEAGTKQEGESGYLMAMQHLGAHPNETVIIGDSRWDGIAAMNLGVAFIGIVHEHNTADHADIKQYSNEWFEELEPIETVYDAIRGNIGITVDSSP